MADLQGYDLCIGGVYLTVVNLNFVTDNRIFFPEMVFLIRFQT